MPTPRPCVLRDGHVSAPIANAAGKVVGHKRKTIGELNHDDLKAMSEYDLRITAGALIGVLHFKEWELARANVATARAQRDYWSLKLDVSIKAEAAADQLVKEGNP